MEYVQSVKCKQKREITDPRICLTRGMRRAERKINVTLQYGCMKLPTDALSTVDVELGVFFKFCF